MIRNMCRAEPALTSCNMCLAQLALIRKLCQGKAALIYIKCRDHLALTPNMPRALAGLDR